MSHASEVQFRAALSAERIPARPVLESQSRAACETNPIEPNFKANKPHFQAEIADSPQGKINRNPTPNMRDPGLPGPRGEMMNRYDLPISVPQDRPRTKRFRQFHTLTVFLGILQSRSKLNRFLIESGRGLGPTTPQQPARQANCSGKRTFVALRFGAKSLQNAAAFGKDKKSQLIQATVASSLSERRFFIG